MYKKWLIALLGLWLLTWAGVVAFGPERNPELRYGGVVVSEAVDPWLERSCYDCHSHRTVWPWYAEVPPGNLLLAYDVAQGRGELNFSKWGQMSEPERAEALEDVIEMLNDGKMPPEPYLWMHREARFSAEELSRLKQAAKLRYGLGTEALEGGHDHEAHEH